MHRKSESFDLYHDCVDEEREVAAQRRREAQAQIKTAGNESQQYELGRIGTSKPRRIEQIGDADLVNGKVLAHRWNNSVAINVDQRPRWGVAAADGVEKDCSVELLKQRQKSEPERAAIDDADTFGDLEVADQPVGDDDPKAVVAA
jgi:hypothetical protein